MQGTHRSVVARCGFLKQIWSNNLFMTLQITVSTCYLELLKANASVMPGHTVTVVGSGTLDGNAKHQDGAQLSSRPLILRILRGGMEKTLGA